MPGGGSEMLWSPEVFLVGSIERCALSTRDMWNRRFQDQPGHGTVLMATLRIASAVGAADDLLLTFKKSSIRMVLIDVESSHVLDSEK